jgi:hypothetical protein
MVSDVVDDEAEGRIYGERLAVTFSAEGEFRDLELVPGDLAPGRPDDEVRAALSANEPVVVWVPETEQPVIEDCPGSSALTVRLMPDPPERWVELHVSGVLLGLAGDDVLVAIRVAPDVDPDGRREAEWLDSLSG